MAVEFGPAPASTSEASAPVVSTEPQASTQTKFIVQKGFDFVSQDSARILQGLRNGEQVQVDEIDLEFMDGWDLIDLERIKGNLQIVEQRVKPIETVIFEAPTEAAA